MAIFIRNRNMDFDVNGKNFKVHVHWNFEKDLGAKAAEINFPHFLACELEYNDVIIFFNWDTYLNLQEPIDPQLEKIMKSKLDEVKKAFKNEISKSRKRN